MTRFMLALLFLFFGSMGHAATGLVLEPSSGILVGEAGSTVGWGFTISNTQNYLVVTSASFDTDLGDSTFSDFVSAPDNFFVVGPGFGASTVWAQSFDADFKTGIGSLHIADNTQNGRFFSGQISLTYDLFSRSPLAANFDPDTDTLSVGNLLQASAGVLVTSSVPLPSSAYLFGMTVLGWIRLSKSRIYRGNLS